MQFIVTENIIDSLRVLYVHPQTDTFLDTEDDSVNEELAYVLKSKIEYAKKAPTGKFV